MKNKWNKFNILLIVLVLSMNINVYAANEEIELDSDEQIEYEEDISIENWDEYVDGIYNTNANARVSITGVVRLGRSGSKLGGSYSTSYDCTVDKIGVKNVKLQYKSSLGIWYNLITLDNRYVEDASFYAGSFTTTGTFGRTYRLKCTHYITNNGTTQTRNNVTEELTF